MRPPIPGASRREIYGESMLLGTPPDAAGLAEELLEMAAEQRESVHLGAATEPTDRLAWLEVTARHADRLAELLDAHGWPVAADVGDEAARAAWLVALHADHRLDVQRRAVELMTGQVDAGRAPAARLAFLVDRALVNAGHPQRYGTHLFGVVAGVPVPWPCEAPDDLDARRAAVGLESWAEYVRTHQDPTP